MSKIKITAFSAKAFIHGCTVVGGIAGADYLYYDKIADKLSDSQSSLSQDELKSIKSFLSSDFYQELQKSSYRSKCYDVSSLEPMRLYEHTDKSDQAVVEKLLKELDTSFDIISIDEMNISDTNLLMECNIPATSPNHNQDTCSNVNEEEVMEFMMFFHGLSINKSFTET